LFKNRSYNGFLTDFHENLEGHGYLDSRQKERAYFVLVTSKIITYSSAQIWRCLNIGEQNYNLDMVQLQR
jgi:hypothetical protein